MLSALFATAATPAIVGILSIITIPLSLRIIAMIIIIVLFAHAIYRHAWLRGKRAIHTIDFLGKRAVSATNFLPTDDIEITIGDNRDIVRGQLQSAYVSSILTVFTIIVHKRQYHILSAFDSLPKDSHRQLRIRLLATGKAGSSYAPISIIHLIYYRQSRKHKQDNSHKWPRIYKRYIRYKQYRRNKQYRIYKRYIRYKQYRRNKQYRIYKRYIRYTMYIPLYKRYRRISKL